MSTRLPIVCIEGPSAAGKSTVAQYLVEHYGYHVIPEVNELFRGAQREGKNWYLERQVDRYQQAMAKSVAGACVVLDGDPFQPLWYNWIYPGYEPLAQVIAFYRNAIKADIIAFPDFYVVLQVPVEQLTQQKRSDGTRQRRNFDRHLEMITPQCRYFEKLKVHGSVKVEMMANTNVGDTASRIVEHVKTTRLVSEGAALLDASSAWLMKNRPAPRV